MTFTNFKSAVVVNTVGKAPVAYLVRGDEGQIAALDLTTPVASEFCAMRLHPITAEPGSRDGRMKVFRVKVFGEGTISLFPQAAYMVVTVDSARSYVYKYSAPAFVPSEDLLWSQNTHTIIGRTIDITLYLTGNGIAIRGVQVQYTALD